MIKVIFYRCIVANLLLIIILVSSSSIPARAQEVGWSQPVLVFEGQGKVAHPKLVADRYGQIHAFWIFGPDVSTGISGNQLYYARLDRPDWPPIDIYVSGANFASLAAVGTSKTLSVMWDSSILAQTNISPPLSAREWPEPARLVASFAQFGLVSADDETLWLGYGDISTTAIFIRRQDPITGEWDSPQFVSNTYNVNAAPDSVRLSVAPDGVMHAVWAEYQLPNGWPPLGVYYSRSTDHGQNWSAAREMGPAGSNQPNIILGPGHNVYMSWVGMAGVGGKYFSHSTDDGQTWSGTVALVSASEGGGSEGAPDMVVDSSGTLYVLFSMNNCVWIMHLDYNGWSDKECLSQGVPSSHTEEPAMTLNLGNKLHVMWWANDRQLWYATRQVAAAGQTPLATPTTVVSTEIPPTVPPTIVPTATHIPDYGAVMDSNLPAQSGYWSVAAGILPVVLLLLIVYTRRLFRK